MPPRSSFTSRSGRSYALVPSHRVLQLDHEQAVALLREALGADDGASLRQLAELFDADALDRDALIDRVARELESGGLVAFEEPDEAGLASGVVDDGDWDDLPSLSDLRPTEIHALAFELLDHNGLPFADYELTLDVDVDGESSSIVLDAQGRWSASDLRGASSARLRLPPELVLPAALARRRPPLGFVVRADDLAVPRHPGGAVALGFDRSHRLVVQAPARHPSVGFDGALFSSGCSFPGPAVAHIVTHAQELTDRDRRVRIGLFGHADDGGDADTDKHLADRRAQAVWAIVTGDHPSFAEVAAAEDWPLAAYQTMLRVLGCNPTAIDGEDGTQTQLAVRAFRLAYNRGRWHDEGRARAFGDLQDGDELDAPTKLAIVDAYHAEMSGRVAPERFLGPKHAGCGEYNPVAPQDSRRGRVTLAVYGDDAPAPADFPCVAGDASACQVDEGGEFRCRFYRERIAEAAVDGRVIHFWDFEWLRTETGKAHISALTDLPDTNAAAFVVGRQRPHTDDDDAGVGSPPRFATELAVLPGLIRNGVAYALWAYEQDDPFDVARWFASPTEGALLRDYIPYYFTVAAHGFWGRSDAPSYALEQMSFSSQDDNSALGLTTRGEVVLVPPSEIAATRDRRVSALRLATRRTGGFES